MLDLLLAAALAEAAATQIVLADVPAGPLETEIRVEAPSRSRRWEMPALDYRAAQQCIFWWEGDLPGFGTVSFGPACPDDSNDASIR